MNLLKKIKFTIQGYYFLFLLWLDDRKTRRRIRRMVPGSRQTIVVNQVKVAYEQGLLSIKRNINNMLDSKTKEGYDSTLKHVGDLLQFSAKGEDIPGYVEAQRKAYVYSGTDVKGNLDKAKMIDKRIQDYKELHKHIELRRKLREQRKKNKEVNSGSTGEN